METDLELKVKKLQAFKDYVHKRLDGAGIEKNPNGEHSKHGCRIGDRLDIVLKPFLEVKINNCPCCCHTGSIPDLNCDYCKGTGMKDVDPEKVKKVPDGLYGKYKIERTSGKPIEPENQYFVLKLEGNGDKKHIEACRKAVVVYANEIYKELPELANDLLTRYDW